MHDFEGFVRFCREQQGGFDYNHYDPFLDEHVGVEGCHMQIPAVASALLAMHNDGVPMLTGRSSSLITRAFMTRSRKSGAGLLRPAGVDVRLPIAGELGHGRIAVARPAGVARLGLCVGTRASNHREPGALFMDPAVRGFSLAS